MRRISFLVLWLIPAALYSQVFFSESFETNSGWSLSYIFDDGNDSYSKRDSAVAMDQLGYVLSGQDQTFVIAAENTDGVIGSAPADGIIMLTLDPSSILGMSDLELVIKLSCNAGDMTYDDRSLPNGDYLDAQLKIDAGPWVTIGQFNSKAGGSSISTLYHDVDMDGDGGELGELPVGNAMKNFVLPISGTGANAQIRLLCHMDGSDEVLVLDDIRLRQSQGDDQAPSVFSAQVLDDNSLEVVFQEPMGTGANQTFHYAGISGLVSASLQADLHTVILDYSSNFNIGQAYQLVVFSVPDLAGNTMAQAFNFPFYVNPSTPSLVITEIMYNDPSVADTLEFIEVYNYDSAPAVVGGFRLEGAVSHTFASVTIPPGGFYLVARNSIAAQSFYNMSFYAYNGQLSDNSEQILLVNADGVILDDVTYNDNVPWPSAADGQGPSMELISPSADNNVGSNWVASSNGLGFINGLPLSATPGVLIGNVLPHIEFDNNDIYVNEIDGLIQLDFYVSAANNNPSSVHLEMIAGTAISPADHGLNTIAELTLPANSSGIETVAFPLVNDNLMEGVEYFTIRMTAVNNCSIGLNDEITIVINDDEYTSPPLFINEILSSNTGAAGIDEFGDADDWFEIYNPSFLAVDIAGYYLSDDPLDLTKERLDVGLSATQIPSGGFILLWADQEGAEGPLHMNFKLSALGESVILTAPDGTTILDQIDFGAMSNDISYGRFCDGSNLIQDLSSPSPGYTNCPNTLQENALNTLNVFPNPSPDVIRLPSVLVYEVLDLEGRVLERGKSDEVSLERLSPGVYIIRAGESVARVIRE